MKKRNVAIVIIVLAIILIAALAILSTISKKEVTFLLPKTGFMTNPLKKVPELNPLKKTNPFTDIYKNPFEGT